MEPQPSHIQPLIEKIRAAGVFAAGLAVCFRSAPGRVDVLGGLAVEAGGTIAQMAVGQRAGVAAQTRDDGQILLHSAALGRAQLPAEALLRAAETRTLQEFIATDPAWAWPILGAWCVLRQSMAAGLAGRGAGPDAGPGGVTLAIESQIPVGAGQASSTAVVIAALLAMGDLWGWKVEPLETALYAHRAETLFGASSGHVIDALTCLAALKGPPAHVIRYSAQPYELVGHVGVPRDVRLVALDTGVRYGEAAQTVLALRLAGAMGLKAIEAIYRELGQRHTPLHGYLTNLSPSLYRQYFRALLPRRMRGSDFVRAYGALPERAGAVEPERMYQVRTAVDHLVSEHEHAENFLQAIEELGDPIRRRTMEPGERGLILRRAGRLLLASHHSYRLRLHLSCPEADWVVTELMTAGPEKGLYGARISACGGGGTVVVMMRKGEEAMDATLGVLSRYAERFGRPLAMTEAGGESSGGAGQSGGVILTD